MKVERFCKQCGHAFMVHECYVKRGQGVFCSTGCATTFRNLTNNPAKRPEVRGKISANHADVSGGNNPMYGKRGALAPGYKDGRGSFAGEVYRKILLAAGVPQACKLCGAQDRLHVHHIDGDHKNNVVKNLVWLCSSCHNNKAHIYERNDKGQIIKSHLNLNIMEVLSNG